MLAVLFAVLLFYLRERRGPDVPTSQDLAWAFGLMETRFMSHTEFFQPVFAQYEWLLLEAAGKGPSGDTICDA
jgi:hypothetical protein